MLNKNRKIKGCVPRPSQTQAPYGFSRNIVWRGCSSHVKNRITARISAVHRLRVSNAVAFLRCHETRIFALNWPHFGSRLRRVSRTDSRPIERELGHQACAFAPAGAGRRARALGRRNAPIEGVERQPFGQRRARRAGADCARGTAPKPGAWRAFRASLTTLFGARSESR